MSKKGLSYEEKKVKMLEIFTETKDFYQLKELERIAPKSKGIVQQAVKEVLQDLVGDSLVQSDKIGTSIYYWSFPSTSGAIKQSRLDKERAELDATEKRIAEVEQNLQKVLSEREETPKRNKLLERLEFLRTEKESLKAELEAFGACDPVKLQQKKVAIALAKESAVRWTENTGCLMKYVKDMGCEGDLHAALGINEDWEDLAG